MPGITSWLFVVLYTPHLIAEAMSEVVDQLPSLEDEETMFNMADIAVFVLFVGGILAFYLYKTWEENNKVSIKPISLQ